jgi:hypothetical protein
MPNFISPSGKWYPAKEKVGLINKSDKIIDYNGQKIEPGEPFVYEGPDRAALQELHKQGVEFLGQDFHDDPDLIARVRQLGYKSVSSYAKAMGYDEKKAKEDFEKKAAKVEKHELSEKVKAINLIGGGVDTSGGGQDRYGGFGPRPSE